MLRLPAWQISQSACRAISKWGFVTKVYCSLWLYRSFENFLGNSYLPSTAVIRIYFRSAVAVRSTQVLLGPGCFFSAKRGTCALPWGPANKSQHLLEGKTRKRKWGDPVYPPKSDYIGSIVPFSSNNLSGPLLLASFESVFSKQQN